MATRTKKDLIKEVANRTGLDIVTVKENIQAMFDVMCEGLGRDGNIEIRNFGIFKVKAIPPRIARNPKTGEKIQVPAKNLIHFKPGQLMKQRVNNLSVTPPVSPVAEPAQTTPPQEPPKEQPSPAPGNRPRKPRPVGRKDDQPTIILLSRPVND